MKGSRWFAVVLVLGLAGATAHADDEPVEETETVEREAIIEETSAGEALAETAAPGWTYPKAYASRPLTMNKFMIRGTFAVETKRASIDRSTGMREGRPLVSIDLGAAFSIFDNLEVGVSNYRLGSTPGNAAQGMFPIVVSPTGSFGDMPLYVRYSFMRKDYVEMAADFVLLVPSWTNLSATFGLPVRIRARRLLTVDTGTEFVILSNGAGLNVELPVKATFNITPAGFIFGDSGFSFQNLARNITGGSYFDTSLAFPVARNQVFVPLGIGGGYTHVVKNLVMIDVFTRFGWNPFVYVNPPTGVNVVPAADSWVLSVGVIIHTSPDPSRWRPELNARCAHAWTPGIGSRPSTSNASRGNLVRTRMTAGPGSSSTRARVAVQIHCSALVGCFVVNTGSNSPRFAPAFGSRAETNRNAAIPASRIEAPRSCESP